MEEIIISADLKSFDNPCLPPFVPISLSLPRMPKVDFLTDRHSQELMSPGFPVLWYLFHHLPTHGRARFTTFPCQKAPAVAFLSVAIPSLASHKAARSWVESPHPSNPWSNHGACQRGCFYSYQAMDSTVFLLSWLAFKPGKRRNIFRLIPILFSHLVLCCWSLPCLRRRPRSALCGIFPSARLRLRFHPRCHARPLIPFDSRTWREDGFRECLVKSTSPSSSPRAFCIVSLWCRRSPRSKPNRLFLARGGMHDASCAASCRQL